MSRPMTLVRLSVRLVRAGGLGLACTAALAAAEPPALPADVARFVARREQCDHFRGEEAYDAERARFLARQARRYCAGTDRALAGLKRRYRNDARITKLLDGHEAAIEGN